MTKKKSVRNNPAKTAKGGKETSTKPCTTIVALPEEATAALSSQKAEDEICHLTAKQLSPHLQDDVRMTKFYNTLCTVEGVAFHMGVLSNPDYIDSIFSAAIIKGVIAKTIIANARGEEAQAASFAKMEPTLFLVFEVSVEGELQPRKEFTKGWGDMIEKTYHLVRESCINNGRIQASSFKFDTYSTLQNKITRYRKLVWEFHKYFQMHPTLSSRWMHDRIKHIVCQTGYVSKDDMQHKGFFPAFRRELKSQSEQINNQELDVEEGVPEREYELRPRPKRPASHYRLESSVMPDSMAGDDEHACHQKKRAAVDDDGCAVIVVPGEKQPKKKGRKTGRSAQPSKRAEEKAEQMRERWKRKTNKKAGTQKEKERDRKSQSNPQGEDTSSEEGKEEGEEREIQIKKLTAEDLDRLLLPKGVFESNQNDVPFIVNEHWRADNGKGRLVEGPICPEFRVRYHVDEGNVTIPPGSETARRTKMQFARCARYGSYAFCDAGRKPHGTLLFSLLKVIWAALIASAFGDDNCIIESYAGGETSHLPEYKTHSDFFFLNEGDEKYDDIFGDLHLDLDFWIKFMMGKKDSKGKQQDGYNTDRGCINWSWGYGHYNCSMPTGLSQMFDKGSVAARPNIINYDTDENKEAYRHLGSMKDCLQLLADTFGFMENGLPLMMNDYHWEHFALPLNCCSGALRSKWDAGTVALQMIGTLQQLGLELDPAETTQRNGYKICYEGVEDVLRHCDGPNSPLPGWNFTAIKYYFLVIDGVVYRLTFIMYTRDSVQQYISKELGYFQEMLAIYNQYKVDYNGGIDWDDFWVKHDLSNIRVTVENEGKNGLTRLAGPLLTNAEEVQRDYGQPAVWKTYTTDQGKPKFSTDYINLCAFRCRFGFTCAYAFFTNWMADIFDLDKASIGELIYAALLSPSVLNFVTVLQFWVEGNTRDGRPLEPNKVNMMEEFRLTSEYLGLALCGGPQSRFQSMDRNQVWPTLKYADNKEAYDSNFERFMKSFEMLENGELLANKLQVNTCLGLCGEVVPLSFPDLALFTGMSEPTQYAIERAITADATKSVAYTEEISKLIRDEEYRGQPDKIAWSSVWKACAMAGDNPRGRPKDFENTSCETIRTQKGLQRGDFIFPNQDFYTITPAAGVLMQLHGQRGYSDFTDLRAQQKRERRAQYAAKHVANLSTIQTQ